MPVVPAVVTGGSDNYAALRPIDSRASMVGPLRAVSMAKLSQQALFREADATERRTDLIVVL